MAGPIPISSLTESWRDYTQAAWDGRLEEAGVPTGLSRLDTAITGLRAGELTVLAAQSSVGKTSLSITMAIHACQNIVKRKKTAEETVLFFSLEMTDKMLLTNLVSQYSGVPMEFLRTPLSRQRHTEHTQEYMDKITKALKHIDDWPLLIDYETMTLDGIEQAVLDQSAIAKPRLIVIDYLQILAASTEHRDISVTVKRCKELAKSELCSVVLLSQLNRGVFDPINNPNSIPMLKDLKGSGDIENNADVVLFIYRPEYFLGANTPREEIGVAYIIVAKQRQGPRNLKLPFMFDSSTTRFMDAPAAKVQTLASMHKLEL